jgi:hypothetical protein
MADVACPLGMFLDAAASEAARMDFEVESHDLRAAADHATRWRSLDAAALIRRLAADVREACRTQGREGASTWVMVDGMARPLADAIKATGRGDGGPWLRDRHRVRELLGEIIAAATPPVTGDAVAMRSAALAAPVAGVERRAGTTARQKGDKGEKAGETVVTLEPRDERFLLTLLDNGATNERDRLFKGDAVSFGRLTPHDVRQAAKRLKSLGMIGSHEDKRGGYWLTESGAAAAHQLRDRAHAKKES